MHKTVAAIASCGASPVVRIAANEAWIVKRALDAGAHGICVPLLYTADDASRLVSSAKFPLLGTRGFGSPFPTGTFNNESPTPYPKPIPSPQTPQTAHAHTPQLTPTSKAEAIARIPGIDVLLIEPFRPGEQHRAPDPRQPHARRAGRRHYARPTAPRSAAGSAPGFTARLASRRVSMLKGGVHMLDFGRGGYDRHTGVLCVNAGSCEGEWQRQRWWRCDQDVVWWSRVRRARFVSVEGARSQHRIMHSAQHTESQQRCSSPASKQEQPPAAASAGILNIKSLLS